MKRESKRFHSTWVEEMTPAVEGAASQVDGCQWPWRLWQKCLGNRALQGIGSRGMQRPQRPYLHHRLSGNKGKDGDMLRTSK
jgi:hypothetical protein